MRIRRAYSLVLVVGLVAGLVVVAAPAANAVVANVVEAGWNHTCVLIDSGGVKCWGDNSSGQLGDGTRQIRLAPVDVVGLSSGVVSIAAGEAHTCALTDAGGVKCWGDNSDGRLGDGTTHDRRTPTDVVGLSGGIAAIAAGGSHTCALTDAGGVKCWGSNYYGQLGDGTRHARLEPVAVSGLSTGVAAIAVGEAHTCALTDAGGVKCWGSNYYGQLGDGTRHARLEPVAVVGLSSGVAAISVGETHTCILTDAGGVKCWGDNGDGRIGDGTRDTRLTPVGVVGLSSGAMGVAAGGTHTCALTDAGGLTCWGRGPAVGDGTSHVRLTPVDVIGLSSGAASISSGWSHSCIVTGGGGIRCWGGNSTGELGDGTTHFRTIPITVRGFPGSDPGVYRPDALIARTAAGPWVGEDVYDPTGKTERLAVKVPSGGRITLWARVQNDGDTLDQLLLEGSEGVQWRYAVRYLSGIHDITLKVHRGNYWVQLVPGATSMIKIVVEINASVAKGTQLAVLLRGRSAHASGTVDAVRAVITVGG